MTSTMHLCWERRGLYYHYGIEKVQLDEKVFGVFEHRVKNRKTPLVRGFDDVFYAPHSRHTTVLTEAIENEEQLIILRNQNEAGVFLTMSLDGNTSL